MKKILLFGSVVLILVLVGTILLYFKPSNAIKSTETVHNVENRNIKASKLNDSEKPGSALQNETLKPNASLATKDSSKAMPIDSIDAEKLVQSLNSMGNDIKYLGVAESGLPPFEIDNLMQDYDNLNRYGSYSGGKITNEFARTNDFKDALKKNGGLENILKKLNFTPTDIGVLLGNGFNLVGADYSGAFNEGKFNSIFRSYESNSGKRFEINEMYLTPENNYSLNVYTESINFYLAGHPATLQSLKGADNKEIYNIDFAVNKRLFSISSEGFTYSEFLQTSIKIANSAEKN
ncbi:hypothetical protein [Psychrobacter immobilis]|jgi:hypothetical protein|uniref:hypothetical protein n=1 Tax=Psychrobacter immobilis TaxID=498 RepID=UPI00191AF1CD|nr:hypothetical protein [Psychrobacter immobilis]